MSGREKAIEHITKEIETTINNIFTFRIRSAFTLWVGPFILLGAVIIATRGEFTIDLNATVIKSILGVGGLYLTLGVAAGLIERGRWKRCDNLRVILIGLIANDPIEPFNINENLFKEPRLSKLVVWFYFFVFSIFVIIVGLFGVIAINI